MEQYTGWQQQHQQQHASAPPPPDAVGHSEFLQAVQRLVCGLPDSPAASVAAVQLCAKQLKLFRCEQLLRSSPSVLRSRSQAATGRVELVVREDVLFLTVRRRLSGTS